jgi:hypothetical protein
LDFLAESRTGAKKLGDLTQIKIIDSGGRQHILEIEPGPAFLATYNVLLAIRNQLGSERKAAQTPSAK